jgi:D-aminopeptidase
VKVQPPEATPRSPNPNRQCTRVPESLVMARLRLQDYDLRCGTLPRGPRNLITDVRPVTVGHCTLRRSTDVRTGVTVIDPGVRHLFKNKLPAATAVGNGYGKLVGVTQINELGTLESPIALTNTMAVGRVLHGLTRIVRRTTSGFDDKDTINAVVGETNDGCLNAIHDRAVRARHVREAYDNRDVHFQLGSVGAGTGTQAFGWKGGIGSASRVVTVDDTAWTVGALVQTNFGGSFTFLNVPIGRLLCQENYSGYIRPGVAGSCMVVLATEAPLTDRQLRRLAKRGLFGLIRTGSIMASGSGDYAIAFSTTNRQSTKSLADEDLDMLFLAAAEAVEEAVYDAMFTAESMDGRDGNVLEALPVDKVLEFARKQRDALGA